MLPRRSSKHEIGPQDGELRPATHRPGGDAGARLQAGQRGADERVAGVAPGRHGRQHETAGGDRRQVLGRVHGQIGAAVEDRLLHLLDEHALAADGVQRHVAAESPAVSITTSSLDETRVDCRRRAATCSACHCASALPRVAPGAAAGSRQVEQVAHGVGVALAARRAGVAS